MSSKFDSIHYDRLCPNCVEDLIQNNQEFRCPQCETIYEYDVHIRTYYVHKPQPGTIESLLFYLQKSSRKVK